MKYWNKNPPLHKTWTHVYARFSFHDMKVWCQQQPSKNRFFCRQFGSDWYFEDVHDALVFSLKWKNRNNAYLQN